MIIKKINPDQDTVVNSPSQLQTVIKENDMPDQSHLNEGTLENSCTTQECQPRFLHWNVLQTRNCIAH